jgi:hypothetical protein
MTFGVKVILFLDKMFEKDTAKIFELLNRLLNCKYWVMPTTWTFYIGIGTKKEWIFSLWKLKLVHKNEWENFTLFHWDIKLLMKEILWNQHNWMYSMHKQYDGLDKSLIAASWSTMWILGWIHFSWPCWIIFNGGTKRVKCHINAIGICGNNRGQFINLQS